MLRIGYEYMGPIRYKWETPFVIQKKEYLCMKMENDLTVANRFLQTEDSEYVRLVTHIL